MRGPHRVRGMETRIEGVELTDLRQIPDERGDILHVLRSDAPDFTQFGECYVSEVRPGAVKAWKRHSQQTQNLAVPAGRVRVVVYDDRRSSATVGSVLSLELGRPDAYQRLRISPGLWYGFECLGDEVGLIVNCPDLPHDPQEGERRPVDDPTMPHPWGTP